MNRTLTSHDSVVSLQLQQASFLVAFVLTWRHQRRRNGDISGQLTRFSTSYTALRAVKETEKFDESHVDLTRQCGKSPV